MLPLLYLLSGDPLATYPLPIPSVWFMQQILQVYCELALSRLTQNYLHMRVITQPYSSLLLQKLL
jgi:hypothetical protein